MRFANFLVRTRLRSPRRLRRARRELGEKRGIADRSGHPRKGAATVDGQAWVRRARQCADSFFRRKFGPARVPAPFSAGNLGPPACRLLFPPEIWTRPRAGSFFRRKFGPACVPAPFSAGSLDPPACRLLFPPEIWARPRAGFFFRRKFGPARGQDPGSFGSVGALGRAWRLRASSIGSFDPFGLFASFVVLLSLNPGIRSRLRVILNFSHPQGKIPASSVLSVVESVVLHHRDHRGSRQSLSDIDLVLESSVSSRPSW